MTESDGNLQGSKHALRPWITFNLRTESLDALPQLFELRLGRVILVAHYDVFAVVSLRCCPSTKQLFNDLGPLFDNFGREIWFGLVMIELFKLVGLSSGKLEAWISTGLSDSPGISHLDNTFREVR